MIETLNQQEQDYFTSQGETDLSEGNQATQTNEAIEAEEKAQSFSRTVPHGALHAERAEHKKTRAALAQLKAQHAQMLMELGNTHKQQENQENRNPPDPTQDFLGFTRWQNSQQSDKREEHQLWQVWEQVRETSRAQLPDLDAAIDFLAGARERQLSALGQIDTRFQDKKIRLQQMQTELLDLVGASLNKNENPAVMIYELARAYGYGAVEAAERFQGLDKAQKAARTLTASNGHETGDAMLMETLAALPEADFARWYEANPDAFRRLFTG